MSTDVLGSALPSVGPSVFAPTPAVSTMGQGQALRLNQGFLNTLIAAASPYIQFWLLRHGFLKYSPNRVLADNINDRRVQAETLLTLYGRSDNPFFARITDSILRLLGVNPKEVPLAEKAKMFVENSYFLAPVIYAVFGERTYDQLFGRAGSPMLLSKAIIRLYAPYGVDAKSAEYLAKGVVSYFLRNPHYRKGFLTDDLIKIIDVGTKNGLIYPTLNPQDFIKQVANVVSLFAAARDQALKEGASSVKVEELVPQVVKLYEIGSGVPFPEMIRRVRVNSVIKRIAPYGVFQAAVQTSGIRAPVSPATYSEDDVRLRQNAIESPVGNMLGATIRAVEKMKVGGPLKRLYDTIKDTGSIPPIGLFDWIQLASRSGLKPDQAFRLLLQTSSNKSVLTPEWVQTIRASQYKYDIAPIIDSIMTVERNPELQRGAIAELASRLGYKNIGMMDAGTYMLFLHNPLIHRQAKKVFDVANRIAQFEESTSGVTNIPPLARATDVLLNPKAIAERPAQAIGQVLGILGPGDVLPLTKELQSQQRKLLNLPGIEPLEKLDLFNLQEGDEYDVKSEKVP
ncbi:MAG: hypothetical protein KatS3mg087_0010 [Patescibacteria group bacterium]|nr:MAG: hypothetical protein KatS3mg087_0010 [Patescibacteria group bacterium]